MRLLFLGHRHLNPHAAGGGRRQKISSHARFIHHHGVHPRVAAGLLNAAGLPETVTTGFDGYEALAVRLAGDPATLGGYRRRLAAARETAPLFDTPRFTRHLERAYRTMWDHHAAGLPPASFTVPPL